MGDTPSDIDRSCQTLTNFRHVQRFQSPLGRVNILYVVPLSLQSGVYSTVGRGYRTIISIHNSLTLSFLKR